MSDDNYFEDEPQLRSSGLFSSRWKQLLTDHLRDCYRQRRVFREALNDIRTELIDKTSEMHAENQKQMVALAKQIDRGNNRTEALQKWIFGGVLITLASLLGWFVTHFGPLAQHL